MRKNKKLNKKIILKIKKIFKGDFLMSNKNKKKNSNYKQNVNKVAEQQLQKMQASKDKNLLKASSTLVSVAIICLFAFIVLLILKLCGVGIAGWTLLIPFGVLLISFITILLVVGKSMMKQGLLDPNAIKAEEQKMMNNNMKNSKSFQKTQNKNTKAQKYNKYKNIK